jgi:hypothetical protein
MAKIQRIGTLQVDQDLRFQYWEWWVERVGKLLVGLIIIGATLGVFGNGYLSRAQASSQSGLLLVEYDRFARRDGPTDILIDAKGAPHSPIGIWFSESGFQRLRIEQITPEQVTTHSSPSRTTYVFHTDDKGRARVRFDFEPRGAGKIVGQVGIDGGEQVTFWTFVYP